MPAAIAIPLLAAAASTGTAAYVAHEQSSAAEKSARLQTDAANRAGELEAAGASDALSFAKQQEAARQKEWQAAQDLNYTIWARRQRNLQPFVNFGTGALTQLGQPIPRYTPQPGVPNNSLVTGV